MHTIVEVSGGVAEVTCGPAVVIDWDDIQESRDAGEEALRVLEDDGDDECGVIVGITERIRSIWPEEEEDT